MSFDWTTANTGVFYRIGKLVKKINAYLATATTTYPADVKEIADPYEAADMTAQISAPANLYTTYTAFQDGITAIRQQLAAFIDQTLADPATVLVPLNLLAADTNSTLFALYEQAMSDSKTVQSNSVTIGSVTAQATPANKGTGTLLVTKVLDGFNAPRLNGQANLNYNGVTSELAVLSETMVATVVGDSMSNGLSEGAEQWSWIGGIQYQTLDWNSEGSGQGPGLTTANGSTLVTDGDFENWSSNTPTSWTIVAGTAGVNIFQETSTIFRGTSSMKFHGDGATAVIEVSQAVSPSTMTNKRRYCLPMMINASAVPAAGNIIIKFTGTGYAASSVTPEVQTLQISGTPTGGYYTVSWVGPYGGTQTTAHLAQTTTSAQLQTALRALIGLESVVVATSAGAPPDVTHQITFHGTVGDINQITADITNLTGGAPAKAIATSTPGVEGEQINLPAAAFPAAGWVLRWFWINLPAVIPSDWTLIIEITSTLSNGVNVFFDSLAFKEVVYHGGLGVVPVAGATRFLNNDRFLFAVANNNAGVWQTYLRQRYAFQLPSSGAPNILDALAS